MISMSTAGSLLLILTGLSIMTFGLFLFYAWLPLLYALVGLDIGLLAGRMITGEIGPLAIALGIGGAIALGAASYFLEPYRRILLGVSGGFLFGLSLGFALGLDNVLGGVFTRALAFACAIAGGMLVPRFFNPFVIGASAISGAALLMTGLHELAPGIRLFDSGSGEPLAIVILAILALAGVAWQTKNLSSWLGMFPGSSTKK
jgi:hypothetical protein